MVGLGAECMIWDPWAGVPFTPLAFPKFILPVGQLRPWV